MNLESLVQAAISEDIPDGDLTTQSLGLAGVLARARLLAKEELVLSGVPAAKEVFRQIDPKVELMWHFEEGALIWQGQTISTWSGPAVSLLMGERVALNFLGHLSGIATLTRCFVQKVKGTRARILDTRKTTPLLRDLEKAAVVHGGGLNHRRNLSEAILIKDNHIRAKGGLSAAVLMARKETQLPIEVECASLSEVREACTLPVRRIMLDNMTVSEMREARTLIPSSIEIEASGNLTLDRVREVAECGVDFLSVGALTHSAPRADLSLEFDFAEGFAP